MSQNIDSETGKVFEDLIEVIEISLKYMRLSADQWTEEQQVKEYLEIKERIYKTLDKLKVLNARFQNTRQQTGTPEPNRPNE